MGNALLDLDDQDAAEAAAVESVVLKQIEATPVVVLAAVRNPIPAGEPERTPPSWPILFIHNPRHGGGGTTIAYQFREELDMYAWASSRCNPVDNYDRKMGARIAKGVLLKYPQFIPDGIRMYPDWHKFETDYIVNYIHKSLRGALL